MRLRIRHQTIYAYDRPIAYAVQMVRLFPRAHAGLDLMSWIVTTSSGRVLQAQTDGLGNGFALHVVRHFHQHEVITVEGDVETRDLGGRLVGLSEALPPSYFCRPTALTESNEALAALGQAALKSNDPLEALMHRVRDAVGFEVGATDAGATAAQALSRGAGVCQDHAHIFLAAARAVEMPARYVSGYLWTGRGEEPASHAWVEAWDGEAWQGLDPANRVRAGEQHVRVAAGLDYEDVAPVRGVRKGAAAEKLDVRVQVTTVAGQGAASFSAQQQQQ